MNSAFLHDYIDNAEWQLDLLIPALIRGEVDRRAIGILGASFRQHGVCTLLLRGESHDFYLRAMQNVGAYIHYLRAAVEEQKVTGDAKSLYDAIGCGYWDAASEIARLSRHSWNPRYEYEEDFLFVFFIMKHFFLGADALECRDLLSRHKKAAEGKDQAHRDVCVALLDGDARLFEAALIELLLARQEKVEALVSRGAIPEEHWSWLRYFSSEGWALLKLAERKGLSTGKDYLHVPEIIRGNAAVPFDPDAWRSVGFGTGDP